MDQTQEEQDIFRKRRMLARDYFSCVPVEKVDLLRTSKGGDESKFRYSYGFEALKCDTVGCLYGWLYTMPEYRDWCKAQGITHHDGMNYVDQFLGDPGVWLSSPRKQDERVGRFASMSDHAVAMDRLNRLIGDR